MGSEIVERLNAQASGGLPDILPKTGKLLREAAAALSAQEEQIERLTNAVTACRPIIERLIAAEHNVETWGLKLRLAAIDAALAKTVEG